MSLPGSSSIGPQAFESVVCETLEQSAFLCLETTAEYPTHGALLESSVSMSDGTARARVRLAASQSDCQKLAENVLGSDLDATLPQLECEVLGELCNVVAGRCATAFLGTARLQTPSTRLLSEAEFEIAWMNAPCKTVLVDLEGLHIWASFEQLTPLA